MNISSVLGTVAKAPFKALWWLAKKPFQGKGGKGWNGDNFEVEGNVESVVGRENADYETTYIARVKLKSEFTERHGVTDVEVPIDHNLKNRPKFWFASAAKYEARMVGGTIAVHIKDSGNDDQNSVVHAFSRGNVRYALSKEYGRRFTAPGGRQRRMAKLMPAIERGA